MHQLVVASGLTRKTLVVINYFYYKCAQNRKNLDIVILYLYISIYLSYIKFKFFVRLLLKLYIESSFHFR